jgi:outer membrane receptor protein involved in Fe transport
MCYLKTGSLRSLTALVPLSILLFLSPAQAQGRRLSGTVTDESGVVLANVFLTIKAASGRLMVRTDSEGRFAATVEGDVIELQVAGETISAAELPPDWSELDIVVRGAKVSIHNSIVIQASASTPGIDRRNDAIYQNALFSRDDQLFSTLDAGVDAGQHEGGGKSVEVRRFGFNLDHGGVSGGLKVLVDNVQQNQNSQAHGQGYLGQLKSLSPELVEDVDILDGPFSPEYGDFSGLGVVHIRQKERLNDPLILRLQGGRFGFRRAFAAFSPRWREADSFLAWESSTTDGPFLNPLDYTRHNLTGNYTRRVGDQGAIGLRLNAGTNRFNSSGQIPLDEVTAGRLDRFGWLDNQNGGRSRSAATGVYYRYGFLDGSSLKVDGFVSRSLLDLFSNFTFFLDDLDQGDGFQQHDSRLQEGTNTQYLKPFRILGRQSLLTLGGNLHDNQINVGLYPSVQRVPQGVTTRANARVSNVAGYAHQAIEASRSVQLGFGIRYDWFRFNVRDHLLPSASGTDAAAELQPKANVTFHPYARLPIRLFLNYGRGIASQDARGVVQRPDGPKLATTDFYQAGTAVSWRDRVSTGVDLFLIDRSHEQVYVPDDGSIEFRGPSRAYGYQAKFSARIFAALAVNGGLTQVTNAFYRGTSPRLYVDSAPHTVGNLALTFHSWKNILASLRYRHTGSYRVDGLDAALRASGLDVVDLSLTRRLRRDVDLNLTIDNLTNKRYYETQNYFESRIDPTAPALSRLHVTPGYPVSFVLGLTYRLGR